ncbi:MAG TPA: hypothetical protein VMH00_16820 [Candidatus Limnocylindrales bacterium]|nr:hypothetical protein [Candidatus Limnocylindrales bacterium]
MTRRGSLVYYLTAWILGCFFMSALIWIRDMFAATLDLPLTRSTFGLLFFYFYGLVFGAISAFVGAFLLRRIMAALKCKTPSHWAAIGAILAPALIAIFGLWGRHLAVAQRQVPRILGLVTFGPRTVIEAGWWLAIPAGAATAFFLCRVQRAFGAANPAAASDASPSASA